MSQLCQMVQLISLPPAAVLFPLPTGPRGNSPLWTPDIMIEQLPTWPASHFPGGEKSSLRRLQDACAPCRPHPLSRLVKGGEAKMQFPMLAEIPHLFCVMVTLQTSSQNIVNAWNKTHKRAKKSVISKYSKLRAHVVCKYQVWRVCVYRHVLLLLSCTWLFVTPWTVARQAPLSMEFSRQEYCSELSFPSPRDLPDSGIKPVSPTLAGEFFTTEPPGKAIDMKQLLKISRKQHTVHTTVPTRMLHFTLTDLFINMFLGASKLAHVIGCPQREVLTPLLSLSYEDTYITLATTQATFWASSGVDGAGEEHCHGPGRRVETFTHLEPPEQTGISAETH